MLLNNGFHAVTYIKLYRTNFFIVIHVKLIVVVENSEHD